MKHILSINAIFYQKSGAGISMVTNSWGWKTHTHKHTSHQFSKMVFDSFSRPLVGFDGMLSLGEVAMVIFELRDLSY